MPVLRPRWESFAQLVASDVPAGRAYLKVYQCSRSTAETEGPALLRKPQVAARVAEIQQPAADAIKYDRTMLMQWLESVLLTPIGEIDEMHPLCQYFRRRVVERKDGKRAIFIEIRMPDKIAASRELARLHNWGKEVQDVTHNVDEILSKRCSKGLPRMPNTNQVSPAA